MIINFLYLRILYYSEYKKCKLRVCFIVQFAAILSLVTFVVILSQLRT